MVFRTLRCAAVGARCTTCRIRVSSGLTTLPRPAGLEATALARISATEGVRLACQIRPMADISVTPLLAADTGAADGLVRGGMEGSERQITVVFVDLRGSTTLAKPGCPTMSCSSSIGFSTK